jgi:hypothetical protein
MEIKAKGKLDLELCKALMHLVMFKKADPKKRMRVWAVVYGIILALVVFDFIAFGVDTFIIVMLGVVVFTVLLMCYLYFIVPKIKYKSLAKMKDAENEYVFCDDVLRVFTKTAEYSGEATIEYSHLVKVYETAKYFLLFQTQEQVLAVDKSTIENGTQKDIRDKLTSSIAGKYIVCKY